MLLGKSFFNGLKRAVLCERPPMFFGGRFRCRALRVASSFERITMSIGEWLHGPSVETHERRADANHVGAAPRTFERAVIAFPCAMRVARRALRCVLNESVRSLFRIEHLEHDRGACIEFRRLQSQFRHRAPPPPSNWQPTAPSRKRVTSPSPSSVLYQRHATHRPYRMVPHAHCTVNRSPLDTPQVHSAQ